MIYVGGYFNNEVFNGKTYNPKSSFVLNLLKGSVNRPNEIDFTQSSINGYINGDNIASVAKSVNAAGFSCEKLVSYIESLYECKHKSTKTYNKAFGDKTYKAALHEQFEDNHIKVAIDEMAEYIADRFDKIMVAALPKKTNTESDALTIDMHTKIVNSYTIKDEEKKSIKNLCGLICSRLDKLQSIAHTARNQTNIINRETTDEEWRRGLQACLEKQISRYKLQYKELKPHCMALAKLLYTKRRLHDNVKIFCRRLRISVKTSI